MTISLLGKNHLAVARRRAGLTIDQLSEMSGFNQLTLLQLEYGPGDPFKGIHMMWRRFAKFGMTRPTDDDPPAKGGDDPPAGGRRTQGDTDPMSTYPLNYSLNRQPTIPDGLRHEVEAWIDDAARDFTQEAVVPNLTVARALSRHNVTELTFLAWLELNRVSMIHPIANDKVCLFRWGSGFTEVKRRQEQLRHMVIAAIHERPDDPPTCIFPSTSGVISARVLKLLYANGYTLEVNNLMVVTEDGVVRGPYTDDNYDPRGL